VKTILLAVAAVALLTGCRSAVNKQQVETTAQSGNLADCAQIREEEGGCEGNKNLKEVYVDNMHKYQTVRVTIRKHSPEGDEDKDYAIGGAGQLFISCGDNSTSFAVVRCELLKSKAEQSE
jgi:hypothetical protein